jgi:pheromone shutdown-related protein TraB
VNIIRVSETVTEIEFSDRKIILVGTAHVSKKSMEEVETVIRTEGPDAVCVEIDTARYKSLQAESRWKDLDVFKVVKEGKGFLLLANLILASFQKRLGKELGVSPGAEMKKAVETAEELSIPVYFCDREVQTTLRRAWAKSGFWGKSKLLAALLGSALSSEKLSEEDLEKLKEKSAMQDMMEELASYMPRVKEVLIDERDKYLAAGIYKSSGKKTAAIVGAGHVEGILAFFEKFEKKEETTDTGILDEIPVQAPFVKYLPWILPLAAAGIFAAGIMKSGWQLGAEMFLYWFLVNGVLSAAGAVISLAHPLTTLLAFAAAPFTSLNPAVGVGLFTVFTEAVLRKPRVADFENLNDDIASVKGFFRNRLTHILLVFMFTSLGSMAGTFIAFPFIIRLLS